MAGPEPRDAATGSGWPVHQGRRGTVQLRVHVHPGARRTVIDGLHDGAVRVRVSAAPERGRANDAVCAAVAAALELRARDVHVVAGHTGRRKTLALSGVTVEVVEQRLRDLLARSTQD
jgi:hypothetical protein